MTAAKINNNDSGRRSSARRLATRLTGQRAWIRDFYTRRTGGFPVAHWVDVVSLHLYPLPKERPEHSMTLLAAARTMLDLRGVHKPIWNTEINYGLQTGGGGTPAQISTGRQAAYVVRTYMLNAASGVKKVFWYSWGLQRLANTKLTFTNGSPTLAGRYVRRRAELAARRACRGVQQGQSGNVHLQGDLYRRGSPDRVESHADRVREDPGHHDTLENTSGVSTPIRANKTLKIDFAPKMIRSAR